jgi:hypothetical protein
VQDIIREIKSPKENRQEQSSEWSNPLYIVHHKDLSFSTKKKIWTRILIFNLPWPHHNITGRRRTLCTTFGYLLACYGCAEGSMCNKNWLTCALTKLILDLYRFFNILSLRDKYQYHNKSLGLQDTIICNTTTIFFQGFISKF